MELTSHVSHNLPYQIVSMKQKNTVTKTTFFLFFKTQVFRPTFIENFITVRIPFS